MFEVDDYTYHFNVSMSTFAFDRNIFPDCDEAAYSIPKDQC